MPKKIRQLKAMLRRAGFVCRPGKGSHTVWTHSKLPDSVVLSGNDGHDARRYQERMVQEAVLAVEEEEE